MEFGANQRARRVCEQRSREDVLEQREAKRKQRLQNSTFTSTDMFWISGDDGKDDNLIPARSDDYFRDLDEASRVFTGAESKSVQDYTYLIDSDHIDDEDKLMNVTKRVMVRKGLIVAYRAQITIGRE
jgi:hypothetical protein